MITFFFFFRIGKIEAANCQWKKRMVYPGKFFFSPCFFMPKVLVLHAFDGEIVTILLANYKHIW